MQWIELTIKTAPAAIDLVCDRLTVLGFDSFIIDDQEQFHEFLEQNRQYWDYVDEDLVREKRAQETASSRCRGSRRSGCIWSRTLPCRKRSKV